MAHSSIALVLAIAATIMACDNSQPAEVPSPPGEQSLAEAEVTRTPSASTAPEPAPVVAWVNGESIPLADLEQQVHNARGSSSQREHVLERLIDERLLQQHLRQRAQRVDDESVDAAIEREIANVFGSREALLRHLEDRGTTIDAHRERVRASVAERAALDEVVPAPDEEALVRLYREVANRPAHKTELRLRSVLLQQPAHHPVDSARAFTALVGRHVDLGWVPRDAMNDQLSAAVLAVEPPGVSHPVGTPAGMELYWVEERRDQPTPHFLELAPMLERRLTEMARAEARAELVRSLRAKAEVRLANPGLEQAQ